MEAYFRARAETVAREFLRGAEFQVRVSALSLTSRTRPIAIDEGAAGRVAPEIRNRAPRDFALNVALRTSFAIATDDQDAIRDAVVDALGLRPELGDVMRFAVADLAIPVELAPPSAGTPGHAPPVEGQRARPETSTTATNWIENVLFSRWAVLIALTLLLLAIPLLRKRTGMSEEERQDFVAQLDALLLSRQEQRNG